jgi:peptide/nickel transport system substrate-binding protein
MTVAQRLLIAATIIVGACGQPASPQDHGQASGGARPVREADQPRGSITIAWASLPDHLVNKFSSTPAGTAARWIFSSYFTHQDFHGAVQPMLARQIPTQDNGDWVINPDGTMVTTYRLRENARWHDGVPLVAGDFAFAYRAFIDPAVPIVGSIGSERLMSSVEARDDHTVVITWREPYIFANRLGGKDLPPLPRHQLEEKYRADPASFGSGDEWTSGFVGVGPYRVEQWEPGVRIVARAFVDWVLGPPRIDRLEIRFISDRTTLLANLLAGEVDFTVSPAIRVSEAIVARDHWTAQGDGYLKTWATRLRWMEFQYREVPNWQRAVADLRVRRALIHAIDREGLADVMTGGLGSVGDAWVLPSDPSFPDVERAITKYPFDPQRAISLLGEAGWRAQPGGLLANPGGQTLDVEVNSQSGEPQLAVIIEDNWKRLGINSSVFIFPPTRLNDREFRSSFSAAALGEGTISLERFVWSSTAGRSFGGFSDAEVDRLFDVAVTSFDETARRQAAVAMNKRLSEIAAYAPIYYTVDVLLAKNRLKGPLGDAGDQAGTTWNIFEWEVID